MKLRNLSQTILDLNICALFILISMVCLKLILPNGPTIEFFDRGYLLIILVLFFLIILFVVSLLFNNEFKIKKKNQFTAIERHYSSWTADVSNNKFCNIKYRIS